MSSVEEALKQDFPEATEAERKRFAAACQDDQKDDEVIKEEVGNLLENYLDWRSCYGLDYTKTGETAEETADDKGDWEYAIKKALEVEESMKRAKELEKKLEAQAKMTEEEKIEVNYDMEFSDSQKEDEDKPSEKEEENGENKPEDEKGRHFVELELSKQILQFIFLHKSDDGSPIKDKNGNTILHVLPARIDRHLATVETYGLALNLYLDRKLDRSSEEKLTIFIDARGGEGWPNPRFVMMVNFVRHLTNIVTANNPERFEVLLVSPFPWFARSCWNAVHRVFKYGLMDKFVLARGPSGKDAPLPRENIQEHIDEELLKFMEQFRADNFKPIIGKFAS